MLHAIVSAFVGVAAFISSLFGHPLDKTQSVEDAHSLGAALPSGTAVFETSLQSRISSTDTSLTLTANSVRGGSSLSGFQCFTVDEGRTDAEYVCGTVSGTSVTGLTRGIDPSTGTTSNSALKFAHRVGADVKITDFPLLQILRNQANGADTYPNTLRYAAGVTPTNPSDLTDKEYADALAFNGAGVIDATSISRGVVELATGAEAAASTAAGSSGNLALPAAIASSTYNAATAVNVIPTTGSGGLLDPKFVFNAVALSFPASQGASSTVLVNDGAGALKWLQYATKLPSTFVPVGSSGTASTSVAQVTVPANFLAANNGIRVTLSGSYNNTGIGGSLLIAASYGGTSTTTLALRPNNSVAATDTFMATLMLTGVSASSQRSAFVLQGVSTTTILSAAATIPYATTTTAIDSTATRTLFIEAANAQAGAVFGIDSLFVEALR